MLKVLTLSLLVVLMGFLLKASVHERYEMVKRTYQIEDRSAFENANIRVYGNAGIEWYINGKVLEMEKDTLHLEDPLFLSNKGERITAKKATFNKSTGLGRLEGNVELHAKDLYVQSESANVDLRNNLITGEGYVYVKEGDKVVRGKSYTIYIKPQRVIIDNVTAEIK